MDIKNRINKEQYNNQVDNMSPKSKTLLECIKAFIVGGLICVFGELLNDWFLSMNLTEDNAAIARTITLIFLGAILTGLNIYQKLGKFAGAGSIVPITGFSNSISASAIEFKSEGFITGLGAKLFTIAGPVLVYGISAAIIYGLILCALGALGI